MVLVLHGQPFSIKIVFCANMAAMEPTFLNSENLAIYIIAHNIFTIHKDNLYILLLNVCVICYELAHKFVYEYLSQVSSSIGRSSV